MVIWRALRWGKSKTIRGDHRAADCPEYTSARQPQEWDRIKENEEASRRVQEEQPLVRKSTPQRPSLDSLANSFGGPDVNPRRNEEVENKVKYHRGRTLSWAIVTNYMLDCSRSQSGR